MRVGWREYLKQRFKKPSKYQSIGIELGIHELHICVSQMLDGELTCVESTTLPVENWPEQLKQYVSNNGFANTPCNLVFSTTKYQLIQIDKPPVAEDELTKALSWSVKDLVHTDDELVVDYMELPAQASGADKLEVVAIPRTEIQLVVESLSEANLQLISIGIAELATCDLLLESDDAVMTLVQQAGQEICLNIVKQGRLYFSRRLRGYENLSSFSEQELQMGVGDNLSIEIQRSMDYFESQLRQAPVKRILLGLETDILDKFAQILQQLTFMPVEPLIPGIASRNNVNFSGRYLPSLGAAVCNSDSKVSG